MVHRKKSHCSLHEGSNGWAKVNLKRWMPREAVRGSGPGLPANCPIDSGSLGSAPWFYRSPGLPSGAIGWDIPELAMEVYSWENHRTKSWISIATFDCPRAMYHDFSAIWLSYLLWGCQTHRCSSSQPKPCKTSPKSTTWTSMSMTTEAATLQRLVWIACLGTSHTSVQHGATLAAGRWPAEDGRWPRHPKGHSASLSSRSYLRGTKLSQMPSGCQNSHWTWPYIVDFPMKNGDFCYIAIENGPSKSLIFPWKLWCSLVM